MQPSRREERREATLQEIKDLAWQQMAENGPASLSLREISRRMRLSSAAIFRYFANRDALLNALSIDAFTSQVGAVEAVRDRLPQASAVERILAGLQAYRTWALANPIQYMLIYGTPVPAFKPDWDLLLPAARRGLEVFLDLVQEALGAGAIAVPAGTPELPASVRAQFDRVIAERGYRASRQALYLSIVGWARVHGLVSLELTGQLAMLSADTSELFQHEMNVFLTSLTGE